MRRLHYVMVTVPRGGVRRGPSATTDGGEAAEALLGIVLAVAFAALLLWRLTS